MAAYQPVVWVCGVQVTENSLRESHTFRMDFRTNTFIRVTQHAIILNVYYVPTYAHIPYILESNPHPFYNFRGLTNQMWIRIACGLDSRSRAGFWKNDTAAVRAVRTI
jgi:hypothetical protein